MEVPSSGELLNPTLEALRYMGRSASIHEIAEVVIRQLGIPDHVVNQPHGGTNQTELKYRLAWSRTYLKTYGLLANSDRGVWVLTPEGSAVESVDPTKVINYYRSLPGESRSIDPSSAGSVDDVLVDDTEPENAWRQALSEVMHQLAPDAFERLCQRVLRESGFIEVQVTGRSGDGGIDGRGIIRFAGLIGFPVLFQCKRYAGSVAPSQIRDFRGAMQGRADRGLFITTGVFTQEAQREATRDGAPPIDLIDGEMLVEKLKELKLGVTVTIRQIEDVEVNADWFDNV